MIKKLILLGGGIALLAVFFFGRDAWSYLRTSVGCLKESVQASVPIEFQLERARQMIKDLVPEVQRNMHLIAKEEVEVQRLQSQISQSEARLTKEKAQLTQLNSELASGKGELVYAGRKYTPEQVKLDLVNRFQRYKTGDATLASLRQICSARQRSLDAARQKLEGMLAAKRQLQVEVENLEARTQMVAAAQTTSNYNFDDSRLGRVKELISNLQTRLDVSERLVNAEDYFHEEIPVDQVTPEDISAQITKYFGQAQPEAAVLVKH